MNFRPLHDPVPIRRLEQDDETAGGVIIPDMAKEYPFRGKATAVRPGARDDAGAQAGGKDGAMEG